MVLWWMDSQWIVLNETGKVELLWLSWGEPGVWRGGLSFCFSQLLQWVWGSSTELSWKPMRLATFKVTFSPQVSSMSLLQPRFQRPLPSQTVQKHTKLCPVPRTESGWVRCVPSVIAGVFYSCLGLLRVSQPCWGQEPLLLSCLHSLQCSLILPLRLRDAPHGPCSQCPVHHCPKGSIFQSWLSRNTAAK